MTGTELYRAVARLGFDGALSDREAFLFAANRGMETINRLRPRLCSVTLAHYPVPPLLSQKEALYVPSAPLVFSAEGVRAWSFTVAGSGTATVREGETTHTYTWEGESAFRRFEDEADGGALSITFSGEGEFPIRDLALYATSPTGHGSTLSDGSGAISYDLAVLAPDFRALQDPPALPDGTLLPPSHFAVRGSTLLLSTGFRGAVEVVYRRRLRALSADNMDEELDLEAELHNPLPLLVAAFVWMDEEPEKADVYLQRYREESESLRRASRRHSCAARWGSVNAWA